MSITSDVGRFLIACLVLTLVGCSGATASTGIFPVNADLASAKSIGGMDITATQKESFVDSVITPEEFNLAVEKRANCMINLGYSVSTPYIDGVATGDIEHDNVVGDDDIARFDADLFDCHVENLGATLNIWEYQKIPEGEARTQMQLNQISCLEDLGIKGVEVGDDIGKVIEKIENSQLNSHDRDMADRCAFSTFAFYPRVDIDELVEW